MSRAKLTSIEAGRGVAALLVVAYHAGAIVVAPRGGRPSRLFGFGYAGVDFFFVLSGFLITFIHARDFGQPGRVWGYARKRLVRILPTYWLVMALLIPALFLFPALSADKPEKTDPLFILQSLLLLPQREPPVLGVSWTLTYEMAFYALIAATIVSARLGAALMVAWVAMIAAGAFVDFRFPLNFLAFPRAAEFFLGMAVASLVRWERRPGLVARHAAALLWGGVAAFAAAGLFEVYGGLETTHTYWPLVYGMAAASTLLGAVLVETRPGAKALLQDWWVSAPLRTSSTSSTTRRCCCSSAWPSRRDFTRGCRSGPCSRWQSRRRRFWGSGCTTSRSVRYSAYSHRAFVPHHETPPTPPRPCPPPQATN